MAQIQFKRGTSAKIAQSTQKLVPGQPLYNYDKNYLTIGNSSDKKYNAQPVTVRELNGYASDDSEIGALANSNQQYYIRSESFDRTSKTLTIFSDVGDTAHFSRIKLALDKNDNRAALVSELYKDDKNSKTKGRLTTILYGDNITIGEESSDILNIPIVTNITGEATLSNVKSASINDLTLTNLTNKATIQKGITLQNSSELSTNASIMNQSKSLKIQANDNFNTPGIVAKYSNLQNIYAQTISVGSLYINNTGSQYTPV